MVLILFFITILTILSSLLVRFFEVTTASAWMVLVLSLVVACMIQKTVIPDVNPEFKHHSNQEHMFLKFLKPISYTHYLLAILPIFFFYAHYQTTGSSPLVWNILPEWFLPALLLAVTLITAISTFKKQNNNNNEPKNQHAAIPALEPENRQPKQKKIWSFLFSFGFLDSRFHGNDNGETGIENKKNLPLAVFMFPLTFFLLPILFPIGTDYDPFVHRAAEQTIIERGFIQPRTILYSGEYGLVAALSAVTSIPVKTVNIWLLPLLAIVILPNMLRMTFGNQSLQLFFLLPFSILATTVPQGLGIFFLFILVCLHWQFSRNMKDETWNKKSFIFNFQVSHSAFFALSALLALASFLTHPFPGIAAFIFLCWNLIHFISQRALTDIANNELTAFGKPVVRSLVVMLYGIALLASSIAIPAALIINNTFDSQFAINTIILNPNAIPIVRSLFAPAWIRSTDLISFVHFFRKNYYLLFFLCIIIEIVYEMAQSRKQKEHQSHDRFTTQLPYTFSFLSVFASALIALFYLQPNVTSGEHVQLFTRLFAISLVFLWPIFFNVVSRIIDRVTNSTGPQRALRSALYALCIAVLIVSNIYLQFPHSDRFVNFKGYLTSQDDLETAQNIEASATRPYLVLANQSVSAAALDQFGFSRYVNYRQQTTDDRRRTQYFYSIPISSRAQTYYLQMTTNPSQDLIDTIFQTYEINEFYLVLNDYWKLSPQSKATLTALADATKHIGANTIFKFQYNGTLDTR